MQILFKFIIQSNNCDMNWIYSNIVSGAEMYYYNFV